MISRIRGVVLGRTMERVEILTPGGVAYEVEIPLTVFERLPRDGAELELRTYQVVREDSLTLFGFLEEREREVFGRLLGASGVGPRLALAMLSTMSADRLVRALSEKDIAALRQIPGIGRKTAERLVLELAEKVEDLAVVAAGERGGPARGPGAEEAVSALVALGYSQSDANAAVRRALAEDEALVGPGLIRQALARLARS